MIDIQQYEGAAGDVDDAGFGPIFVVKRGSNQDVIRAVAGLRDRVFEISKLEVLDDSLTQDDIVALIVLVWLVHFTDDYYRGKADRVSLEWADGSRTVSFNYPPAVDN